MAITVSVLQGGTNSHATTSEEVNYLATDFIAAGVVGAITNTAGVAPATGAFAANAQGTPDMTVAVSTGVAYVTATPTSGNSQLLRVKNSASANVTIASNATGGTRYDWVYIKIDPDKAKDPASGASDVATLTTSRSTSASTDNGTPPTYGYCIAVVTVANGASSITNGNISDSRVRTGASSVSNTPTSYSPTITGFSSTPTGGLYYYTKLGKMVTLVIKQPNDGTSNATTFTITLPFTAATRTNAAWSAPAQIKDNGTVPTTPGFMEVTSGGTVVNIYKDYAGAAFTSSGSKRCADGQIVYEAAV